jgi:hypothetical protein
MSGQLWPYLILGGRYYRLANAEFAKTLWAEGLRLIKL